MSSQEGKRSGGKGTVPITDLADSRAYNDIHDQPCPGCPDCQVEVGRLTND